MNTLSGPKPFEQKKRLHALQIGALAVAVMILVSGPAWGEDSGAHEIIEMVGLALIFACIFGRLWSILYVGGKKNLELVTSGPYSLTRNPLYFSSTVGAVGIGLSFGSVIAAVVMGSLVYAAFAVTASKEEAYLRAKFGPAFDAYARETPAFWPNPKRYRDTSEEAFSPRALRRTFIDGLFFLMVFPAIEIVEHLQLDGFLPILLTFY